MDLEGIMLNEIRWRKANTIRFHSHVESKTKQVNKKIKPNQTHRHRGWISSYQRGKGLERVGEIGGCRLSLHTKCMVIDGNYTCGVITW